MKPKNQDWVDMEREIPDHPKDHERSIKLASIVNDLTPEFEWYSLQLQISDEEKFLIDQSTHLTHIGPVMVVILRKQQLSAQF